MSLADSSGVQIGHEGWWRSAACSTGSASTGTSPTRASGRPAADRRTSPTAGSCAGSRLTARIRLATSRARPANVDRWVTERDADLHQIMERAGTPRRRLHPALRHRRARLLAAADAAAGFIAPATRCGCPPCGDGPGARLRQPRLPLRPERLPDGLRGEEGTFSLCTFWYVDALARAGRLDDARLTFEKMLTYANHLGLFSEEIGLTGEQLGNFPQAFSHLALITAAVNLDYQLDRCRGPVGPVRLRKPRKPGRIACRPDRP